MSTLTVGALIALLRDWPRDTAVTFGSSAETPGQFIDGDPLFVVDDAGNGSFVADGMYIGALPDSVARTLGWS